jgi:hypothetical protein
MPVPGVFSESISSGRAGGPGGGISRSGLGLGSLGFLSVMLVNSVELGCSQVFSSKQIRHAQATDAFKLVRIGGRDRGAGRITLKIGTD